MDAPVPKSKNGVKKGRTVNSQKTSSKTDNLDSNALFKLGLPCPFTKLAFKNLVLIFLGLQYEEGAGKKQDDKKALSYFLKAAEKDHMEALYSVGVSSLV